MRENFVYGRDFVGDAHLDEERLRWLERANARRHATLKEVPRERFLREERHLLLPCAMRTYRSLVLLPVDAKPTRAVRVPKVDVEKRPLSVYSAYVGGAR